MSNFSWISYSVQDTVLNTLHLHFFPLTLTIDLHICNMSIILQMRKLRLREGRARVLYILRQRPNANPSLADHPMFYTISVPLSCCAWDSSNSCEFFKLCSEVSQGPRISFCSLNSILKKDGEGGKGGVRPWCEHDFYIPPMCMIYPPSGGIFLILGSHLICRTHPCSSQFDSHLTHEQTQDKSNTQCLQIICRGPGICLWEIRKEERGWNTAQIWRTHLFLEEAGDSESLAEDQGTLEWKGQLWLASSIPRITARPEWPMIKIFSCHVSPLRLMKFSYYAFLEHAHIYTHINICAHYKVYF